MSRDSGEGIRRHGCRGLFRTSVVAQYAVRDSASNEKVAREDESLDEVAPREVRDISAGKSRDDRHATVRGYADAVRDRGEGCPRAWPGVNGWLSILIPIIRREPGL